MREVTYRIGWVCAPYVPPCLEIQVQSHVKIRIYYCSVLLGRHTGCILHVGYYLESEKQPIVQG